MLTFKLLFLLLAANGVPILLNKGLGERLAWPIDGGACFLDRRPLFGSSKTWRGLIAAIPLTGLAAAGVGLPIGVGLCIGGAAMLGDLFSSFVKRRLGVPSSGMAFGLDQIPESLFPLLVVRVELGLELTYVAALVATFVFLDLVLSRILFQLRIRQRPY
ncbi:CDP-archaeol synthase [Methylocaldum sp.]|uniref:CDP-archaeol synthase n=1 Tax=Methylocaldum sp. TaxID=1969727 RepID=UPI002D501810|nr:CDP-archaeol synthase [Methylocaldum sp.]HYE35141.1 CDP-archaeol synthase [Methylocaldum sp.]